MNRFKKRFYWSVLVPCSNSPLQGQRRQNRGAGVLLARAMSAPRKFHPHTALKTCRLKGGENSHTHTHRTNDSKASAFIILSQDYPRNILNNQRHRNTMHQLSHSSKKNRAKWYNRVVQQCLQKKKKSETKSVDTNQQRDPRNHPTS